MKLDHPLIFATRQYEPLERRICELGTTLERGSVERRTFPDGEHYLRLESPVEDRDVVLLGGTTDDAETLELFDLACGIVRSGASRLTLVLPYFGYATMERAVRPGEVVTAKNRARLLSAIPSAGSNNRLFLLDLHSEGLPYYFEAGLRATHIYAKPIIHDIAQRLGGQDFVLAATDAGRAKWVESLANDLGVPAAFIIKRRLDDHSTEVAAVSASVQGRHVVLYDDMIRTGSSLVGAARAYLAAGAAQVSAVATHGVFPDGALTRLRASGLIQRVVTTDSHPRARPLADDFLEVVTIAGLLEAQLCGRASSETR